jgi:hypothetical protein
VLRLKVVEAVLRLEVWDNDAALPHMTIPDLEAEGGRGLLLVDVLSARWGSYPSRFAGKTVWCEVATAGKPSPGIDNASALEPLPKRVRTTGPARATR